jgi:FAD/FMN-containing dehydrogenase
MATTTTDLKCDVFVPSHSQTLEDVVPRWSQTHVNLPALVVKPDSEDDIVDAINYAKDRNLTLVVANGTRAPFVPVTSTTLYLNMRKFDRVFVDKAAGTVTIGGGASTGEVISGVTGEGYYTL